VRHLLAGGAAALTLALASPALATPQKFYFGGCGATPVNNLTAGTATWSQTAPTGSIQGGQGCTTFIYTPPAGAGQSATFGGSYAGEVAQIDLTLHSLASQPLYRQLALPVSLRVSITAGGEEVFSGDNVPFATEASGSLPGGWKGTTTIPDVFVTASAAGKPFVVTVAPYYNDDPFAIAYGAGDVPSSITFYSQDDLPDPEPEEEL
jgi:hypothetical protein